MAASIVLVFGAVIAWQIGTAPELSPTQIIDQHDQAVMHPMADIDRVLGPRGLTFTPDQRFEMNQFESASIAPFQGKEVPVVVFRNAAKNAHARVYIVRDRDFNWNRLPKDGASVPSVYGFQLAVLGDRERSDVAYIVVYTGSGLDLFLEGRSSL